jgi:hypothetical protein
MEALAPHSTYLKVDSFNGIVGQQWEDLKSFPVLTACGKQAIHNRWRQCAA